MRQDVSGNRHYGLLFDYTVREDAVSEDGFYIEQDSKIFVDFVPDLGKVWAQSRLAK
jgi:hypothetical protein